MKAFVRTIAVMLLFASCCPSAAKGNGMETFSMVDGVGGDYTANATAIELKKQEMLAMNESIEEYNTRLGRKIGSVDAACNAIDELIDIYNAGNQPEMNTANYVESILMHYKTVYAYYRLIEFVYDYKEDSDWDLQMRALYYREFKEWFDIHNAVNGIMYFYS